MKIYLAYRYTREDHDELRKTLHQLCPAIEKAGHTCYCCLDDQKHFLKNNYTHQQILEHALHELDKSDTLLAYIKGAEKSEGMLLEIGYALAKKKRFILAVKKGVRTTFLHEIAHQVIEWETMEELIEKLKKLKVSKKPKTNSIK